LEEFFEEKKMPKESYCFDAQNFSVDVTMNHVTAKIQVYELTPTIRLVEMKRIEGKEDDFVKLYSYIKKVVGKPDKSIPTMSNDEEQRVFDLRRLQNDFGADISLVESARELIKDGRLIKLSEQTNKEQPYHFFLFSHFFLYANEGIQTKWKVHRVMHLSLCKIVDLKNFKDLPHAFKIQSPQKSFVVGATNATEKKEWLDALFKQGAMVIEARNGYFEAEKEKEKDKDGTKRLSMFIGHSNILDGETGERKTTPTTPFCNLCIRPFAIFRKRTECKCCHQTVCSECQSQKIPLSNGKKRKVCDSCYGVLTKMVTLDNSPSDFLSEMDCSKS